MVAHLSLQSREFTGEVLHQMFMVVVIGKLHIVLIYFILHVKVSIQLNEDLDHI